MPPDAKEALEARLSLLTLALEDALRKCRWTDAQSLLDQRAAAISDLANLGGPSPALLVKLQAQDTRIFEIHRQQKEAMIQSQQRIQTCRKAGEAYRMPATPREFDKAS